MAAAALPPSVPAPAAAGHVVREFSPRYLLVLCH